MAGWDHGRPVVLTVFFVFAAPVAGDGPPSAEQSRVALIAIVTAIVLWQLGMRGLAHLTGWYSVARRYAAGPSLGGGPRRSELLVEFRRRLPFWYFAEVAADSQALALRLPIAYAGHRAISLPWTAVATEVVRVHDEEWIQVQMHGLSHVSLRFRRRQFRRLVGGMAAAERAGEQ